MTTPCVTGRSPSLGAVLDAVRSAGLSAMPAPGQGVSELVLIIAVHRGENPVALQAQVREYWAMLHGRETL